MGASMVDRLALRPLGDDGPIARFESVSPTDPRHVFGGLVIALGLRGAQLTVPPELRPRALHASFVVAGAGEQHLVVDVERTGDDGDDVDAGGEDPGRLAGAVRRVVVRQPHGVLLVMSVDFAVADAESEGDSWPRREVPGPDGLPVGRYDSAWFESRDVPVGEAPVGGPVRHAWYRATAPLPDDPALHLQAIAYLSDHGPTRAAREPHAHLADDARRLSVSLDHNVWFHRGAVDAGGWLLSELRPVSTGRGRGLAIGTIRDAAGGLIATVAQEVLLRERRSG